jgi:hypothetical protein
MMDITPDTHFLKSIRGARVDYTVLCGEAVDNAFDAGAREIKIYVDRDEIIFEDDGSGITRDNVAALFRLGDHRAMNTTQLGRFGMGIKVQAINAGDLFDVQSTSAEGRIRLQADWQAVVKSGRWELPEPQSIPALVGRPTSTKLRIAKLRPARFDLEKIRWELAMRFHPALAEERRIWLNDQPITAAPDPEMSDVVTAALALSGGRWAELRAGILVRPSKLRKVHVAYGHRVIMPESNTGCDNYTGLNQMFARLTIGGPIRSWHLGQFKDDLTDEDEREELEAAALEVMRPILEKVDRASSSARVDEMRDLLNDMLPAELHARPKYQGNKKTAAKEKAKSGEVDPNKAAGDGPAKSPRQPRNQLTITFDGVAEEHGIGHFEPGRPHRVNLSRDNPSIAKLVQARDRDRESASVSLYMSAISLYVQGVQDRQLHFFEGAFGKIIADLLAKQPHGDEEKFA